MSSTLPPPTVFVVDDDDDMRRSLQGLIDALGFPVRTFAAAEEFHRWYRAEWPGCLVLDIRMPGQSGLDLYAQLLDEQKRLPVIFITAHADVATAVAAMKTGAIEFLEKPFDRRTLLQRIEKALAHDAAWRTRERDYRRIERLIDQLTPRQRETLDLIVAGETNKAMAARLIISERAVEMRRAGLMRKLGVRSVAELVELAITHRMQAEWRAASRTTFLA